VRADRRDHRDLFWALCGGGGSFAIVTAIEFELIAVGEIQAGGVWFPVERASEVMHAWREWAPTLPDHVSTSARILNIPPIPEAPEALRGKSFALVLVSVLGDAEEAARVLEPIRALGPAMDTVQPTAIADMIHLAMDPPKPVPGISASAMMDELTPAAVDTMVEQATSTRSLVVAYITLGGGAQARRLSDGAVTSLHPEYLFFAVGIAPPPMREATRAEMRGVEAAMQEHATGRGYLNFAEGTTDVEAFFGAETYARLRAITADVDPAGRIRANHDIAA
jgi:FAD/FMN-containing dehydrogenase